ncbi:MAG: SpoIIIAH-like family protein, partial [Syntrophomonadaceae bacterium]|nr:SpoIIIAH-like family protein [Syntrophomonadaceae bacterium]
MVLNLKKKSFLIAVILCLMVALSFAKVLNIGGIDKDAADLTKMETPAQQMEEQIGGQKTSGSDFFATYRVERERIRGHQTEMLQSIINDRNTEKTAREAASMQLMNISADMEREMKAENLIKSLGFLDCVV